jgi:hypothetical protein
LLTRFLDPLTYPVLIGLIAQIIGYALQDDIALAAHCMQQLGCDILYPQLKGESHGKKYPVHPNRIRKSPNSSSRSIITCNCHSAPIAAYQHKSPIILRARPPILCGSLHTIGGWPLFHERPLFGTIFPEGVFDI